MDTSLILIRHGQSTWNAERRWQGQADPPLTERGRTQALDAAAPLDQVVERFDAAYSSPQIRAAETADLLAANTTACAHLESVGRVQDLRERSAGPWSGLTKEDIETQYPGFLDNDQRPDGYELDQPLFERVQRSLLHIATEHPRQTVLIVCHGGVINTLVRTITGIDERLPNLSGYRSTVASGEFTRFEVKIGERLDLLGRDQQTGGDSARV